MPTYEETEGIVVLEALAMKKPVIIRDIPVYDDWLHHGIDCYKGANNDQFKSLIHGIIKEELEDTCQAGYQVALDRNLRQVGKELVAVYSR